MLEASPAEGRNNGRGKKQEVEKGGARMIREDQNIRGVAGRWGHPKATGETGGGEGGQRECGEGGALCSEAPRLTGGRPRGKRRSSRRRRGQKRRKCRGPKEESTGERRTTGWVMGRNDGGRTVAMSRGGGRSRETARGEEGGGEG